MYTIRDRKIIKIVEIVKQTEKGSYWAVLDGMKKKKLVSGSKIFNTMQDAQNELDKNKERNRMMREVEKKKAREIKSIADRAWSEFHDYVPEEQFYMFDLYVQSIRASIDEEDAWGKCHELNRIVKGWSKNKEENYEQSLSNPSNRTS